jgi:hypothetical protein
MLFISRVRTNPVVRQKEDSSRTKPSTAPCRFERQVSSDPPRYRSTMYATAALTRRSWVDRRTRIAAIPGRSTEPV